MTGVAADPASSAVAGARADAPAPRRGVLRRSSLRIVGLVAASLALVAVSLASVLLGTLDAHLTDVLAAISGPASNDVERVIRHLRIPRTLTGLVAGAALGVAGMVMQGVTRNPLASPSILGVTAGASLAVVLAISLLGVTTVGGYVWFAFAGAAIAAVFVYTLASMGLGGATPVKLALAGAAFTALVSAVTTGVSLMDASTLDDFRFWVVGSLTRADGGDLRTVAPFCALGAVAAVATVRSLNALALGDDMARSLGLRLWSVRALAAVAVILLAGGATALAGPVAFVGLVVPHVARMIVGPDYRWILPWTLVLAPLLVVTADIVGRLIIQPQQLQVGIVTAFIGAPFFLYLVRRRTVAGL